MRRRTAALDGSGLQTQRIIALWEHRRGPGLVRSHLAPQYIHKAVARFPDSPVRAFHRFLIMRTSSVTRDVPKQR